MAHKYMFNGIEIDFAGDLGIIAMSNCEEFGKKLDDSIKRIRKAAGMLVPDTFLINIEEVRFANGEGKIKIHDTVRGKDVFIVSDTGNYSRTYKLYGHDNRMGPDDHYQDIKRVISAIGGKAARVNVIMPMLYASRQDKREGRESLDCSMILQELENMGVRDLITFDAHNAAVQNAVSVMSFENIYATYEIVKNFISDEPDVIADRDNLLIISPDVGGMGRAIYYSNVMKTDVGMFYKRRDYSIVESGRNPIVCHEYLGKDVAGKNVMIIDDMIGTGESMAEIVQEMKRRNAAKVFVVATFGMFTKGIGIFQELFDQGLLTRLYTTNLTHVPTDALDKPWFNRVDMSPFAAELINNINMNRSIEPVIDATTRLKNALGN
ncbi:MAG: ribose-phosphate pyrophosphokinase [Defluviitaleaceae bacterium]|nr:ribose-phosphate pyrophosphokinase [Defluviitaleaceae bacterium]